MLVKNEQCVGCGQCVPYCIVGAIHMEGRKAVIDQDLCLECGVCLESRICKKDALYMPELGWPRELRAQYSNPRVKHPKTNMGGRGTEEVKTNDVTGRVRYGEVGLAIEMGRPGIGTSFQDVEKMTIALAPLDIEWETANPVVTLFDMKTGKFHEDVLNEKVLSCILEMTIPLEKLEPVLKVIKETAGSLDTVFSLDFISTYAPDGTLPGLDTVKELGFDPMPNAKFNLGMGRPLFTETNA